MAPPLFLLSFFVVFISLSSLSFALPSFSNNYLQQALQANKPPALIKHSVRYDNNCGNTHCNYTAHCPDFPFLVSNCLNNRCIYEAVNDANVCTEPSQCTAGKCNCDYDGATTGCKCDKNTNCESGNCVNGMCQPTGYLGQYCQNDTDCFVGACSKDNVCALVTEGGVCSNDSSCELSLYCNSTCVLRPLCNETDMTNYAQGYCPGEYAQCYHGTCYPYFTTQQDYPCVQQSNCVPGLACVPMTPTEFTCQNLALNTACYYDSSCSFYTQKCLCSEPVGSSPQVCTNTGNAGCTQQAIAYFQCSVTNECFLYDINDNTTNCGKNCLPLYNQLQCCEICAYPEYADNAYINVIGSCANNTMTHIDCCSIDGTPCTIMPTYQLCAGF